MMNSILQSSCQELLRRIELAKSSIIGQDYPKEVRPCFDWVIQTLNSFEQELNRIQKYVLLNLQDNVLDQTWYNELAGINNELEVLDSYYIHALYRLSSEDKLALKVIQWLHQAHPITQNKPFIISNGSFSIAPSENTPTLYWLPVTSQLSLLHFPLFYHEFGHQLFLYHKREMEDLIAEFQNKLAGYLQPPISQSDAKYQSYSDKAADIVETWREWVEELFCDAVGLTIGGKSYLLAFSHFIRLGGLKEFFVPEKYLSKRSHPVSFLRVHFLSERARKLGLEVEANELEEEWNEIARVLGITEDYFGYYEDQYSPEINSLLDDLLTEANPISFTEVEGKSNLTDYYKLIQLAWNKYTVDPENYGDWEKEITGKLLRSI